MVPKLRLVCMKDVPKLHREEASVIDMVRRQRLAGMKDVPTMQGKEVCASATGPQSRDAV